MCCFLHIVYFVFNFKKLINQFINMLITEDKEIDIFVASKIGSFKHIKYHTDPTKNNKKCIENLVEIKSLQKDDCITCMEWGNHEQTEILLGRRNQQVQIFNTEEGFTKAYTADFGTGDVVGLGRYKRRVVAAIASGTVKIWSKKQEVLVDTGGKLDQMKMCHDDSTLFATGGEENDLKIWRIGELAPIFVAKNLPNDWLQLRRPVWVSGLAFLPGEGGRLAAVCSRYGYVRLYDSRAQRRPVCNIEFPNMAATCITPSFDQRLVLVGFGRGQLHQVDLRNSKPDKGFKGAAGAITTIGVTGGGTRLVVSGSLDRQIRVHEYESKALVYKQYLTSKLSAILIQTERSTPLHLQPDGELKDELKEETDDMDVLFDNMQTVGEKSIIKENIEPIAKKSKPSAEGSTIEVKEDADDPIKMLLRSTEKQKRRLEKKKKQKKAKSVFHNA